MIKHTHGNRAGSTLGLGLLRFALKYIHKYVQYLAKDGTRYVWQQDRFVITTGKVAPIMLLSRAAYDEQFEHFAIASKKAVKQVLKQRGQNALQLCLIMPKQQGQRKVAIVTPKANVMALCKQAKCVLPISWLLAADNQTALTQLAMPDGQLYQLNSHQGYASLPANPLIANSTQALTLLGGHTSVVTRHWQAAEHALLWPLLFKLPVRFWQAGFVGQHSTLNKAFLPYAALCALLAVGYVFTASYLVNYQLETRQQQLARLSAELGPVLAARNTLLQLTELQQALAASQQQAVPSAAFWSIIAMAQLNAINLSQAEASELNLTLQGNAPSATGWLQQLLNLPFVSNADFAAPVRRTQNGREQFTITLQLRNTAEPNSAQPNSAAPTPEQPTTATPHEDAP
ncbi:hypothetical protein [Alishewanella longhuensis]